MKDKNLSPTLYPANRDLKKVWFVRFYDRNGQLRKRRGGMNNFKTVGERLKEAQRIIDEINNGNYPNKKRNESFIGDMSNQLEERKPLLTPKTYSEYCYILECFAVWFYEEQKTFGKNVNPSLYVSCLVNKGYTNNYIRKHLVVLKKLINECDDNYLILADTINKIKVKKIKGRSKLPFHDIEIKEILPIVESRDPQLRDAIDFLYYLYFRPGEVRKLKIEHILFNEMKILATDDVVKDDDNYYKAVPIQMQKILLKYRSYPQHFYIFGADGVPGPKMIGTNSLSQRMTAILRELKYNKRYTIYSWVHTGIKKAALSRIPIKQLQMQKGHSDLKMFDEYLKDLGAHDCTEIVNSFSSLQN